MYKVLAIGSDDMCVGFALAGVDTCAAEDGDTAADILRRTIQEKEYGIVILDQTLAAQFDAALMLNLSSSQLPLVITVPGKMQWRDVEAMPRDAYLADLIRQAVGYQLDLHL